MMFDGQARAALVVVTATLAVSGVGFRYAVRAANAYLAKQPVPLRKPLTSIPQQIGPWVAQGGDLKLTAEVEEALGTQHYFDRVYVREGDSMGVNVHIVYYTGLIDAVPHVPDRCFVAGGWAPARPPDNLDLPLDRSGWSLDREHLNLRTGEPYPLVTYRHRVTDEAITVRMPVGGFELRTTEFRKADRPDRRIYAGYFFIANGETTPWPERVRSFAFDLKTRYAYYAKVQFTTEVPEDYESRKFTEMVSDLLAPLLPELMDCLPDWAEVEAASSRQPSSPED